MLIFVFFKFLSDKECRNVVDIAFVIDSSGSIGRKNWERMRRFLKALVSKLDVDSSATHIAAIAYSTKPKVEMKFDGLQSTNQVNRLFDRMLWQRGVTYTDKALLLANKEVFQTSGGMRLHVPKVQVLLCLNLLFPFQYHISKECDYRVCRKVLTCQFNIG